jgi:hypothetical protein
MNWYPSVAFMSHAPSFALCYVQFIHFALAKCPAQSHLTSCGDAFGVAAALHGRFLPKTWAANFGGLFL